MEKFFLFLLGNMTSTNIYSDRKNMNDEIFEREIAMCRKLNQKNGGRCNWGTCETCGVIPLLYKLNKGVFLEKEEEIRNVKHDVFASIPNLR